MTDFCCLCFDGNCSYILIKLPYVDKPLFLFEPKTFSVLMRNFSPTIFSLLMSDVETWFIQPTVYQDLYFIVHLFVHHLPLEAAA